jgi:hypothetical protein
MSDCEHDYQYYGDGNWQCKVCDGYIDHSDWGVWLVREEKAKIERLNAELNYSADYANKQKAEIERLNALVLQLQNALRARA